MLKKIVIFIFTLWFYSQAVSLVFAQTNNKFGIHVLETSDISKAQELVNSSGGDWGYVTAVLREDDLNKDKWQKFMDEARKLHLIPILRIATKMQGNFWTKPQIENLNIWPEFLNSLNWPTKQQIIIAFNEPNHAKEWGGEINPREYALVLDKLISLLKDSNPNFYILNAGFDQAADGRNATMDEDYFLSEMQKTVPDIINKIDGWSSHSYPNHGFIGSPLDVGRRSIKGYEWEINVLKSLRLNKDLPIYITETGWPHSEGLDFDPRFYPSAKVAELFKTAFNIWINDPRIKAITPFVLDYPADPFDHFAWLKKDNEIYEQFTSVKDLKKEAGNPEQIEKFEIEKMVIPDLLPTNYMYKGKLTIKNTGQWIMGERKNLEFIINNSEFSDVLAINEPKLEKGQLLEPGKRMDLSFTLKTGRQSAVQTISINGKDYTIYIYKPFDWTNKKVSFWRQMQNRLKLWWLEFSNK